MTSYCHRCCCCEYIHTLQLLLYLVQYDSR